MYSDLFDHLGSNSGGGSGGNSSNSNEKQLVSFKAGKMDLTLQENGNYWAAADTRRGEIRLTWKTNENTLYWEWYNRREKSVADSDRFLLYSLGSTVAADGLGTMERVQNVPNAAEQDRLYVWSRPPAAGTTNPTYHMFWMQDASDEKDDELIAKVNQYLADPASANPSTSSSTSGGAGGSSSGTGASSSSSSARNADSSTGASGGSSSNNNATDRQQVDALSNILENLGMPQNEGGSSSSGGGGAASSSSNNTSTATGTLTLADLQGAMANLQQQSQPPGPPLQELVTPAAITSLLENEAVKKRLMELLPEEQRSEEFLEENLRSPQVQQTLRSLTMALLPDDTGSMDGYHSVLANFNMAEGAQEALQSNSNNPIQAFLECVLKSVEKESGSEEEGKEDDKKDDDKKEEESHQEESKE